MKCGDHTIPVTAIVLTYNEARNIGACLDSLRPASEVIIVDSFSRDSTLEIARRYTSKVVQHEYVSHPAQWQWVLDNVAISHEWIFAVDADFRVTDELWEVLAHQLHEPGEIGGYYVRHAQVFRNRRLYYGTLYPRYWLRIFKKNTVKMDTADLVDVHFKTGDVGVRYIEADVVEDNANDRSLRFWVSKQLRFAKRQAMEEGARSRAGSQISLLMALRGTPDDRILWLKQLWFRSPRYVRPFALFFYRYILRFGFLDGHQGLVYHFTQALLYRLAVDVYLENVPEDFEAE